MKIAIMSDVHGNPRAFKRALSDSKIMKAEKVILLGDVIGYGYNPNECIKLAQEKCDVVLKGNHDAGAIGELSLRWFNETAASGVMRHRSQLSESEREWLCSLNHTYKDEKHLFVCSHGAYFNPSEFEYIQYPFSAQMDLEYVARENGSQFNVEFVGHTHCSIVYEFDTANIGKKGYVDNKFVEYEGVGKIKIKDGHSYSVNVGSVGYPRNEEDSVYVIYDTDKKVISYRRLKFDLVEYQTALGKEGISIPHWLSRRIDYKKSENKIRVV